MKKAHYLFGSLLLQLLSFYFYLCLLVLLQVLDHHFTIKNGTEMLKNYFSNFFPFGTNSDFVVFLEAKWLFLANVKALPAVTVKKQRKCGIKIGYSQQK